MLTIFLAVKFGRMSKSQRDKVLGELSRNQNGSKTSLTNSPSSDAPSPEEPLLSNQSLTSDSPAARSNSEGKFQVKITP